MSRRIPRGLIYAILIVSSTRLLYAEDAPEAKGLSASEIMKRVADTYSSCKTYRDTGIKTTRFLGDNPFTKKITFSTAFVRVQRFRFEYKETQSEGGIAGIPMNLMAACNRMIICLDETGIHSWWGVKGGIEKHTNLMMAIAGATGVSGGTAHTVPALLMPFLVGLGGNIATTSHNLTRLDDAEQDGVQCFRVQSKADYREPETFWIDQRTFLLRRIDESAKLPHCTTEEMTVYHPEINVEIPPEQLAFNVR